MKLILVIFSIIAITLADEAKTLGKRGILSTGYGYGLADAAHGAGLSLDSGLSGLSGLSGPLLSGSLAFNAPSAPIVQTISRQVGVIIPQPVPVTINRPVAVPVAAPYAVIRPRPYPVLIQRPVAVPQERHVPVSVPKPVAVPVAQPVAVPVPQPYAVEVAQPYYINAGSYLGSSGLTDLNLLGAHGYGKLDGLSSSIHLKH